MADLIKPAYTDVADIMDINSNTDEFAARISNLKTKQSAKTDPAASGTSATFIDTVSQDTNGAITATKKTVRTMGAATSSAAGSTGLVPAPAAGDDGKFLKGNGTWGIPTNTTYSTATASTLGLVKIGYTASGKNYPVQLSNGQMYVNVPWTDTNTTYSTATSSTLGLVKIGYTASGKNYPVALDGNGKMYVNVPWTDTNTTYSEATSAAYGLVKVGFTTNATNRNYAVLLSGGQMYVNVPWTDTNTTYSTATASTLGLVKIGFTTNAANRNYAVLLSNGQMYVNVPWSDTNTTYGEANASTYGLVKTGFTTSGKNYAVQLSGGQMYVNVPWTDTNTNTWRGMQFKTWTKSNYSIGGGAYVKLTANDLGASAVSGYTAVGVATIDTGHQYVDITGFNVSATGTSTMLAIHNNYSNGLTITVNIKILYLQNA